jgi:hypothetical protein
VALDGAGVAGAAISFAAPEDRFDRVTLGVNDFAKLIFEPVIAAATAVLNESPAHGRVRCSIVAVGIGDVLQIDGQHSDQPGTHLGFDRDIALPSPSLKPIARGASYAYARSVGVPAFT